MILSSGGFHFRHDLPEVDSFNFAPHVTIPGSVLFSALLDPVASISTRPLPMFPQRSFFLALFSRQILYLVLVQVPPNLGMNSTVPYVGTDEEAM